MFPQVCIEKEKFVENDAGADSEGAKFISEPVLYVKILGIHLEKLLRGLRIKRLRRSCGSPVRSGGSAS